MIKLSRNDLVKLCLDISYRNTVFPLLLIFFHHFLVSFLTWFLRVKCTRFLTVVGFLGRYVLVFLVKSLVNSDLSLVHLPFILLRLSLYPLPWRMLLLFLNADLIFNLRRALWLWLFLRGLKHLFDCGCGSLLTIFGYRILLNLEGSLFAEFVLTVFDEDP